MYYILHKCSFYTTQPFINQNSYNCLIIKVINLLYIWKWKLKLMVALLHAGLLREWFCLLLSQPTVWVNQTRSSCRQKLHEVKTKNIASSSLFAYITTNLSNVGLQRVSVQDLNFLTVTNVLSYISSLFVYRCPLSEDTLLNKVSSLYRSNSVIYNQSYMAIVHRLLLWTRLTKHFG